MFSKNNLNVFIVLLINALSLSISPIIRAETLCSSPSSTIPNNNSTGITDTLSISDSGDITDINVIIDVVHSHIGELTFTLEHDSTSVTLIDQPGIPNSSKGCLGKNFKEPLSFPFLTIDDEGTGGKVEDECTSYDPAYDNSLSYQPNDSLSGFDSHDINGDWKLTVVDNHDFNTTDGTLKKWCVEYERVSNAALSLNPAANTTLDFGNQVWGGTPSSYSIVLEEGNQDKLVISSANITGEHADDFSLTDPEATAFPFTIVQNTSYEFKIECNPSSAGLRKATLTLTTNIPSLSTIEYPLNCTGLAANYNATPAADTIINFGDSDVNTATSNQSLSINNTSNDVELTLSATITGKNASDFNIVTKATSPLSSSAGSTSIELNCTPSAGGKREATLELTTNDPDNQTVSYPLQCTGNAPIYKSKPPPNSTTDFGTGLPGASIEESIEIKNSGNKNLEITASLSGDTTVFSITTSLSFTLTAGGSVENIGISCTLPNPLPASPTSYTATLKLVHDDPILPSPTTYTVTCTGTNATEPLYDSIPAPGETINLGSSVVDTAVSKNFIIQELGNKTLEVTAWEIINGNTNDFKITTAFPITINNGGADETVTVECTPLAAGIRTATLKLTTNALDDPNPTYLLECTGLVAGYSSTPVDTLTIGETPVGEPKTKSITIEENGGANLIVNLATDPITGTHADDFSIKSPSLSSFPLTIVNDSGDTKKIKIQCTPSGLVERTAQLHLISNDPNNPTLTYDLSCTGKEAVGPGYTSTPTLPEGTINFGSEHVGKTVTKTFDIQEIGTAVLDVGLDTTAIIGTHKDDFSVDGSIFPFYISNKGPDVTVTVTCKPSAEGLRTATLQLTSSDPLNPKPTYTLECTGTPPLIPGYSSTPAPNNLLDLGSSLVGDSMTKTIQIQEIGNATLTVALANTAITGVHADDFSLLSPNFPFTISDDGSSQNVVVQCQPSEVGTRTATLNLVSDDPNNLAPTYQLKCTGTSPPAPPPQTQSSPSKIIFTLTIIAVKQGTISSIPSGIFCGSGENKCKHTFESGTQVKLTITPDDGWEFDGWDGPCVESGQMTMMSNLTCKPQFVLKPATPDDLEILFQQELIAGKIDFGTQSIGTATTQTFTITNTGNTALPLSDFTLPAGFSFVESLPDSIAAGKAFTFQVQMDAVGTYEGFLSFQSDNTVFNFPIKGTVNEISTTPVIPPTTALNYTLTISKTGTGNGTVSSEPPGIYCGSSCLADYLNDTEVKLMAQAEVGSTFIGWGGACNGLDTTIIIAESIHCEAQFDTVINESENEEPENKEPENSVNTDEKPPPCSLVDFINEFCDLEGRTARYVTIGSEASISNVVLEGTTTNLGWVSNALLTEGSSLKWGVLTGYIVNQGILAGFDFRGAVLEGGLLSGMITNNSQVKGIIKDVSLAPNTKISGGLVGGYLIGDASAPARLENLKVTNGSYLENIIIGNNVKLGDDVTYGPGVQFINQLALIPGQYINRVLRADGEILEDITIGPNGKLSDVVLTGTIQNQGSISDATLQKDGYLSGGILSKQINNQGTIADVKLKGQLTGGTLAGTIESGNKAIIQDVDLAENAQLSGGKLQGKITGDPDYPARLDKLTIAPNSFISNVIIGQDVINEGTIVDFEFRDMMLTGGQIGGRILNTMGGTFKDVQLMKNTHISGGNLMGEIIGDVDGPALLESLTIPAGSYLENVIIGDNVRVAKNVTLGPGVTYLNEPVNNEAPEVVATAVRINPNGDIQVDPNADFISRILTSDDNKYQNQAMLTYSQVELLKLAMTITVHFEHVGQMAELLMVALYKDNTREADYMRDGKNKWQFWDEKISHLVPTKTEQLLGESLSISVYKGDLTDIAPEMTFMSNGHLLSLEDVAGEYQFYVGYKVADGTLLYNLAPIHLFVERAPDSCILYAVHDGGLNNSQFLTIDLSAGLEGDMKPLGPMYKGRDIEGLALHPSNKNLLYGSAGDHAKVPDKENQGKGHVYTIHRETGELTWIGATGFEKVSGLAFNPHDHQLWGWARNETPKNQWTGIITIDPETGIGTPVKQFDYRQHDMGGLTWNYEGTKLYASGDSTLWVYDVETQTIDVACKNMVNGRIEGLDMQPNGFLLVGVDRKGKNNRETSILAYDPAEGKCEVVHKRVYKGLKYDDIESIVWPARECNDLSWLSDQATH